MPHSLPSPFLSSHISHSSLACHTPSHPPLPSSHIPLSSLACHTPSYPIFPPRTFPFPPWPATLPPIPPSLLAHSPLLSGLPHSLAYPLPSSNNSVYTGVAIPSSPQEYESRVTHFNRANPSHNGNPWFSHVAISGGEEVWYAEILLFKHA
ncbi:unnamed protein product [Closterium sp. Naga37s-1]|nr:unnamed protein product [Closterium sp. Naga37s-1]